MVWGIIAAVIAVVASAGVYYQQKKMEAQAAKQAQEAKAVQVSGHDSNRGLYTVYGQTLVGSTIVWKVVTDKEARMTQSGFTTISAATGSHLTTNKDHKNNRWLYRAVTLCNGPVTEITNVTIDDEGYRSPRFTNKTNKHFATTYSVGPTAGQNFSALRNAYASDFSTWASDAVGKGVAYAIERLYLHKDKPAYQGEPQTRYRVKGRALYDPRKDSTSSAYDSNLGTSSHRADTATTWEYSDNPVLALLDYMRSGEYGRGLDLSVIDIDSIAVSADKCDVLVDIPQRLANDTGSVVTYYDPETGEVYVVTVNGDYPYYRADQQTTGVNANKQRRFRINMAVDPSKEILDNIQEILNVFRGNLSYANGKYFVHMADVASPVLTLNDDDIIGGLKIANGDRSQRMNRATVKFINQAKQYKTDQVSWPSLDSNEDGGLYATYLTQDEDEKLHRTFTIKGCTDFYQAQDTAEFLVRDSRSNLSVSGTFGSRCFGLIPGDVVALDYDSSGFSGKYFRVIQTQVDLVSMNVGLQLKEYDSSVYTWNTSRGNEPLGLSWQEEVVNADPTNLTIGTITTNTTTRSDGSASQTLTIPFSDVPEAAQYVEIGVATNNTTEYETHLVFDTENQTQAEIPIARDNQTYAVRARYFATNSYGTLMPSAYTETTHAVASLSGTKLDGIATGATQNTGALADLDTVDTAQIDNDAITVAKLDTSLESTNYQAGVSGWKLTKAGVFEAGNGTFRGALTATSGSIANGVTIGGTAASTIATNSGLAATATQPSDIPQEVFSSTIAWNFETGAEGWTLGGGSLTHNSDGYIVLDSTSTDPVLQETVSINGARDNAVLVKIRRTGGSGWQGTLYYSTSAHSSTESYRKIISDPTSGTTDWVIAEWDMTALNPGGTDWVDNTITALRFDFGNAASDDFEIDWIAVGQRGAAPLREGAELRAGSIGGITITGDHIQSDNFSAGVSGFKLEGDGTFEAGNGTFRGAITATSITLEGTTIAGNQLDQTTQDSLGLADSAIQDADTGLDLGITAGSIAGVTINSTTLYQGTGTFNNSNTGFYLDDQGQFSLKDKLSFDGTDLSVSGSVTASAFTLSSGATLTDTADLIANTNNNAFFRFETTAANDAVAAPTNTEFSAAFGRNPRTRDVVIVVNTTSDPDVSAAYVYNGSSWDAKNDFFTGDVIVDGTITADHLSVNSLEAISADMGSITSGSLNINSGAFAVTSDGVMSATGATVSGAITATSLTLSGTSIAESQLETAVQDSLELADSATQDDTAFAAKVAWGFDEGVQGWSVLTNTGTLTHNSDGYVVLDSTGSDPILFSPTLGIDGAKDFTIRARIKRTSPSSGATWQGTCYYSTSGHGDSESYKKNISDPTVLNEWVVAEWDMSNLTNGGNDWISNTITRIRLDFGNTASDDFQIDWIAIGTKGAAPVREGGDVISGSIGGISIDSSKLYAGAGTWQHANTGFYLDNDGKFSLKDKLFFDPSNNTLTVDGNITADVITAKQNLIVLGDLQASSVATGSITRAMLSQDALDEIFGSLASSVGGSNGDFKDASGTFTTSGGSVTLGTSSDKFDHGSSNVDVEFNINTFFYSTTNYTQAQASATLTFEATADGTFNDLNSADKTHTLQFFEYDLSSYYGYTYLVYHLNTAITKTFTSGSGNDLADNVQVQFRVAASSVGSAFTGQTIPFDVAANEGVTGVTSTGGNADTLDNLDSTKFLRSDQNDTFDGDLTVTGTLILQGDLDTYNVTNLDVTDKTITVNKGNTQTLSNGAGLVVDRGSAADATLLWNETDDKFAFNTSLNVLGDVVIGNGSTRRELKIKSNSYAEIQYFITHANNSNVETEYIRAGASVTNTTSYNQVIGDYFLYTPQSNKMLLTVPQNGDPLKRNNGAITIIDTTNYDDYSLPLTGGVISGPSTNTAGVFTVTNTHNGTSNAVNAVGARFINSHANHTHGIVAEFRTEGTGSDRPTIVFTTDATDHTWVVGPGTTGSVLDDFTIGYRDTDDNPSAFTGWHTPYLTLEHTTGNAIFAGKVSLTDELNTTDAIRFSRGNSDYANIIRSTNFPSETFTASTQKHWLEYATKGGHHFVVNTDGGADDAENDYDHFTIWQGAVDGRQLFRLTNAGNATLRGDIIVGQDNATTSWGGPKLATMQNWDGSTYHPTLTSNGTFNGIFLENVHINFRTDNARSGTSGRSGIRMARNAAGSWWDAGLTGDQYEIYRQSSNAQLFVLTNTGNATFAGSVTWTGGSSTNANTAYGWGDHGVAGYVKTDVASTFTATQTFDGTSSSAFRLHVSDASASWDAVTFQATDEWGDGNDYGVLGGDGTEGIMIRRPHVVWNTATGMADIRLGRSGGVATGAYVNVGVKANNVGFLGYNTTSILTWDSANVQIINNLQVGHDLSVSGKFNQTTADSVLGTLKGTTASGYAEYHIANSQDDRIVIGSIGPDYTNASFSDSRYIYSTAGKLHLKASGSLVLSSGGTGTSDVALTADSSREITIHNDMNLVGEFNGDLFVRNGKITVKRGTGLTTTIIEDDSGAGGRGQLLLDSHYSDMIIASRNANTNKHGSTLTFATQSTSTTDYAKIVIGQGQYQEGAGLLAFAYATNQTNPHNVLGTDNAEAGVVMDLYNKRIGIGGGTSKVPNTSLHVSGGKIAIASTSNSYGQLQIANTADNEASIGFFTGVTESTLGAASPTATHKWGLGLDVFSIGTDTFGISNSVQDGAVVQIAQDGKTTFGEVAGFSGSTGRVRVGTDATSGWGTTKYPWIGSDGSTVSLVMIQNPHVPHRTDNISTGQTSRAAVRMASNAGGSLWWDVGVINGNQFALWHEGQAFLTVSSAGQATFRTDDHNYLRIENLSVAKEQMVRFRNSQTNYWYAGIRTSSGINSTADFHIYSTAYGNDVFGVDTSGQTQMRTANIEGSVSANNPILRVDATASVGNFNWATSSMVPSLTAGQHVIHLIGKAESTRNSGYIGYKWASSGSLSNRITFGHYGADDLMYLDAAGNLLLNTETQTARLNVHQTQNAPSVCITSSNPSTWGASLLVGTTTASYTAIDSNDRPMVVVDGKYPVLALNHTVTSNSNHGPTIQFTATGYNSNRQAVIGADGQCDRIDFGFSGGTAGTNSNFNPHHGIGGYSGTTAMRLFQNGLLVGATGIYPNEITSTDSALDVRGDAKVSGSITKTAYNEAHLLQASGTASSGSAIGFQQITAEGWTGIFVDYNPYEGWGLYHDNPSNYFYITAEGTTGSLGTSFTVPNRNSGSSTAYAKIRFDQNNGNINAGGAITANGNVTAYASDRRLKTNFRQIDSAVAKVQQLNGMIFDWNDVADANGFTPDRKYDDIGLIAQEVEAIVPQAVELAPFDTEVISTPLEKGNKNAGNIEEKRSISGEDYLTVNYSKLVPLLVNAIKEQSDELAELKLIIEEMKNGDK